MPDETTDTGLTSAIHHLRCEPNRELGRDMHGRLTLQEFTQMIREVAGINRDHVIAVDPRDHVSHDPTQLKVVAISKFDFMTGGDNV